MRSLDLNVPKKSMVVFAAVGLVLRRCGMNTLLCTYHDFAPGTLALDGDPHPLIFLAFR